MFSPICKNKRLMLIPFEALLTAGPSQDMCTIPLTTAHLHLILLLFKYFTSNINYRKKPNLVKK